MRKRYLINGRWRINAARFDKAVVLTFLLSFSSLFIGSNSHAWWSWPQSGTHSTHHKISEAAYGLVSGNLTNDFMKNPERIGYTYPVGNDVAAHGGNAIRNGGDIESFFNLFISNYNAGDNNTATKYLGYCIHLIEDMHVPAHAYNIKHAFLDALFLDEFEYLADGMAPSVGGSNISVPDALHIATPALFYQDARTQTKINVNAFGFSGYYHEGDRGGEYANWNGDGPKGYYTIEEGIEHESLDFDLFPGGQFINGTALLQNQLNESAKHVARFLLAVDKRLSISQQED
ncbi:MAG: hypothetical protein ACYC69_01085 [Thermodesulfovibrionales bacterium]